MNYHDFFRMITGENVIEVKKLNEKLHLIRLINRGGVPYSVLVDNDGFEIASIPTSEERRMLRYYRLEREAL